MSPPFDIVFPWLCVLPYLPLDREHLRLGDCLECSLKKRVDASSLCKCSEMRYPFVLQVLNALSSFSETVLMSGFVSDALIVLVRLNNNG